MLIRKRPVVLHPCEDGNDVEQWLADPKQLRQVQVRAESAVSRMNLNHTQSKSDAIVSLDQEKKDRYFVLFQCKNEKKPKLVKRLSEKF